MTQGRLRVGKGRSTVGRFRLGLGLCLWVLLAWIAGVPARAAIQFDVFLGYGGQPTGTDGAAREVGWFSLGCEILNDGASFNGLVEVSNEQMGQGQTRRFALELPTNTRKRFVIPAFASARGGVWTARLLDERGRVRAKVEQMMPRSLAWESMVMGAVPRTFAGAPKFPDLAQGNARQEMQPLVARIPVELLPDNPIAYEGLEALYLNSEKALELKEPQAEALEAWVRGGGHLVLAVEQPADVTATRWLRTLLPCTVAPGGVVQSSAEWHAWLRGSGAGNAAGGADTLLNAGVPNRRPPRYRPELSSEQVGQRSLDRITENLPRDTAFEGVDFPVASARVQEGEVLLMMGGRPMVVTSPRDRGRVTVMLFSPEREPFKSWKHRDWFWARLMRLPAAWYGNEQFVSWGGNSSDGVFGAMIDSRQVRKLPVKWLLLLLVVYLVVIGPFDQWVLKRLNRQMLTWVTFPSYIVVFSLLIYYIGYRLRAGETEWNELHVVDVMPRGSGAELRGRTFGSIYSPVNATYRLASDLPQSTLRSEFMRSYGAGREGARVELQHRDRGFEAEVFVPVWTSQLLVSDWWDAGPMPLEAEVSEAGGRRQLTVRNKLGVALEDVRAVAGQQLVMLGRIEPGQERVQSLGSGLSTPLIQALHSTEYPQFGHRVQARYQAFGTPAHYQLALNPANLMAVSLLGVEETPAEDFSRRFVYPPGMELSRQTDRGDLVVLAWVPGHAAGPGLRRFPAVRSSQNTYYRLVLPSGGERVVARPGPAAGTSHRAPEFGALARR